MFSQIICFSAVDANMFRMFEKSFILSVFMFHACTYALQCFNVSRTARVTLLQFSTPVKHFYLTTLLYLLSILYKFVHYFEFCCNFNISKRASLLNLRKICDTGLNSLHEQNIITVCLLLNFAKIGEVSFFLQNSKLF